MGCDALVLVDLTRHVLRAQNLYAFCSMLINHFLSKTSWKTYKKRGATRGLSKRSPILVLLSRAQNLYAFCSALINHFLSKTDWKTYKKREQHEDFPGGHPSEYYSRPSTLSFGVLIGSGALVLV